MDSTSYRNTTTSGKPLLRIDRQCLLVRLTRWDMMSEDGVSFEGSTTTRPVPGGRANQATLDDHDTVSERPVLIGQSAQPITLPAQHGGSQQWAGLAMPQEQAWASAARVECSNSLADRAVCVQFVVGFAEAFSARLGGAWQARAPHCGQMMVGHLHDGVYRGRRRRSQAWSPLAWSAVSRQGHRTIDCRDPRINSACATGLICRVRMSEHEQCCGLGLEGRKRSRPSWRHLR